MVCTETGVSEVQQRIALSRRNLEGIRKIDNDSSFINKCKKNCPI